VTSPIRDYLDELGPQLRGGWLHRRRTLAEVRDHLADTAAELERRGVERSEAEKTAVERFGDVAASAELLGKRRNRTVRLAPILAGVTLLTGLGLLWLVENGGHPSSDSSNVMHVHYSTLLHREFALQSEHVRHPHLLVSQRRVQPGEVVRVVATGCGSLQDERDEMTWHNHRQLLRSHDEQYTAVFRLHRQGYRVTATFRVPEHSPPGVGLLDVYCGGDSTGQATAMLSVA
jgi:hypothetical protein